jgi:hypothetical protein
MATATGDAGLDRARRVPDADRQGLRHRNGHRSPIPASRCMAAWASSRKPAPRNSPATCACRRSTKAPTASRRWTSWAASCRMAGRRPSPAGRGAETAETRPDSDALARTVAALRDTTEGCWPWRLNDRFAGSVPYACAFALTLGGHYHLKAAMADPDGPRAKLARGFLARQLAAVPGLLIEAVRGGSDSIPCRRTTWRRDPVSPSKTPPARRGGRGRAEASSGCACRCRWRWITSMSTRCEDEDGWTLIDTGLTRGAAGRRGRRPGRSPWRGAGQAGARHPSPPRSRGPCRLVPGAWAELLMTRTAWLFARMLTLDEQETRRREQITFWTGRAWRRDPAKRGAANVRSTSPMSSRRCRWGSRGSKRGSACDPRRARLGRALRHGHAPDHATLWSEDGEIVIGGDQLLPSISPNLGVYATEPDADPWPSGSTHAASCSRSRPGPAGPAGPQAALHRVARPPAADDRQSRRRAGAACAAPGQAPRTAAECFAPLYKREIDAGTYGLALVEAVAHLNHLFERGEVTRTAREDGAWVWSLAANRQHL